MHLIVDQMCHMMKLDQFIQFTYMQHKHNYISLCYMRWLIVLCGMPSQTNKVKVPAISFNNSTENWTHNIDNVEQIIGIKYVKYLLQ